MEIPQLNNIKKAEGMVNMNYDHLIEINGDVNDTNHFIKQISSVAEQAITNRGAYGGRDSLQRSA